MPRPRGKKSTAAAADDAAPPPSKKSRTESPDDAAPSPGRSKGPVLKVLQKGRGVVDVHSGLKDKAHVYETSSIVFQCTLNQTNIEQNNNKFYIVQLLESDSGGEYWVWTRWGRVGVVGQSALDRCSSLPDALQKFKAKYYQKTLNEWTGSAAGFKKHEGKYHLMEIDYSNESTEAPAAALEAAKAVQPLPSSLPPQLQSFLRFIGSTADMERAMKELEVDTAKMPLGKISRAQVKQGFQILKIIEKELSDGNTRASRSTLIEQTSMFYTLIPHNFGFSHPPIIDNVRLLKRKMDLLEMLSDIEVATKLLQKTQSVPRNPLDATYESLKCKIDELPRESEVFKRIGLFVANTHGATHTAYRLVVTDIFTVTREGEATQFAPFAAQLGNRMMLWHGSRSTNFLGILSQGLRIAPPEAPSTGYMFGKGVYFADCITKASNYCHTSPSHNEGVLLLCEVALGKSLELTEAKYMEQPQKGFHSTKGVGRMRPNPAEFITIDNVVWPLGTMQNTPIQKTSLLYNEYIIYNVAQLQIRFVVRCRFDYQGR